MLVIIVIAILVVGGVILLSRFGSQEEDENDRTKRDNDSYSSAGTEYKSVELGSREEAMLAKGTTNPVCPNCDDSLEEMPKRKRKCPHCGEVISVASKDRKTYLLSVEDVDRYRKARHEASFARRWLRRLENYGLRNAAFDEAVAAHRSNGREWISYHDVLWGLFNSASLKNTSYEDQKMLHYDMAIFLAEEGKSPTKELSLSHRAELLAYKRDDVTTEVEILTSANSCPACVAQSGTVLSIDQALDQMPLPCEDCSYDGLGKVTGFCRCTYVPRVE